jgi:peptide/nickel transport system permease protein
VLSRTIAAIQLDLTLALACAVAAFAVGSTLGTLAGFIGGIVDEIIMRLIDILAAFPAFVLAILVAFALGDGVVFAVIGVALAAVPEFVRLTRARALSMRRQDFVLASRVLGVRRMVIAWTHILPNSAGPAIVQAAFVGGWAILYLAGLAFLGVGVQPPQAEWGVMISEGSAEIVRGIWWSSLFPGLFILLAAVGFHMISDGLSRGQRD